MANQNGLRLGCILFSFTNEYHARQYSLDQLLEEVARRGIGPGVEIVGFSAIRGFPYVSDAFAGHFRETLARLGLEPSCMALNADVFLRPNQPMTADESLAYHVAQLEAAAMLGFPVARYQFLAGPEVIRKLLPIAERLNVKLGLEIHAPHKVDSPEVMEYREMYAKENSPYLGFIPDFGTNATAISPAYIRFVRQLGMPERLIQLVQGVWNEPDDPSRPLGKHEDFVAKAKAAGFGNENLTECFMALGLFSRQEPRRWLEIMPQIVHIHGKFHDIDEKGEVPNIPYDEILPLFADAGYNGFMSSEWEGHFFTDDPGLPMVEAHHALCKRILGRS
jgi:sugar phosphate isomerase/epimerase